MGCCSSCKGTGASNDVETNGLCWDCYGTGHTHLGPCDAVFERRCRWVLRAVLWWIVVGPLALLALYLFTT